MTQNPADAPNAAEPARLLVDSLTRLLEFADRFDRGRGGTGLVARVTGHLGCEMTDLTPKSWWV